MGQYLELQMGGAVYSLQSYRKAAECSVTISSKINKESKSADVLLNSIVVWNL